MKDKTNEDWTVREARREAMHEMEKEIPMLASERTALRNWVGQGNDPGFSPGAQVKSCTQHYITASEKEEDRNMKKELRRSATDCKLCGVCGGLGEYFNLDSNLIRLLWAAFSLFAGSGIILYIIAAILMPKAEEPQRDLKDVIHPEDADKE